MKDCSFNSINQSFKNMNSSIPLQPIIDCTIKGQCLRESYQRKKSLDRRFSVGNGSDLPSVIHIYCAEV